MHYKLAQLALSPTQRNQTLGEVYVAQPDLIKEGLLGKLFVVVEIHSKENDDFRLASFLINEFNKNYYQNEKAIMRESLKSISIEQVFESALAKTNKALYDQLANNKLVINPRVTSITVGVVHEGKILFSGIGKNRIFLIYKSKLKPEQDYNLREITPEADNPADFNINKVFANLINGSIPPNGYIFFANEALPEYLSTKQLIDIITTLPPLSAMEQVKNRLEQVNAYISFFAVLIKNTVGQTVSEPVQPKNNRDAYQSINNLRTTEAQTERLLTPTGLVDVRHWLDRGKKAFAFSRSKSSDLMLASKNIVREKLPAKKRNSRLFINKVGEKISGSALLTLSLFSELASRAISTLKKGNIKDQPKLLLNKSAELALSPANWLKGLSKKNQTLIIAGTLFIFLFFINLAWTNHKQGQVAVKQGLTSTISLIEEKENEIEKNLIPKNYDGAKAIAKEVQALLAELPAQDQPDKKIEELKNKFAELEKKIRKETEAEVIELANLNNYNQTSAPENINFYNNKLYLGDTTNKTVYQIDPTSKVINAYGKTLEEAKSLSSAAIEDNLLYFWNNTDVIIYNLDKLEGKNYPVKDFDNISKVTRIGVYSDRIYLVAPEDKQIYRLNYVNGEFVKPRAWFNTDVNMQNLRDIYLDGNVYLMFNDNRVEKFSRGTKQTWSPSGIEPKIESISSLITGDKYTYVADNKEKRIVVLDGSGKYLRQLKNDSLNNIRAMTVSESKKLLYVLNDKTIYSVSLNEK